MGKKFLLFTAGLIGIVFLSTIGLSGLIKETVEHYPTDDTIAGGITIDGSGRIGVSNTSPALSLDVVGADNTAIFRKKSDAGEDTASIYIGANSSASPFTASYGLVRLTASRAATGTSDFKIKTKSTGAGDLSDFLDRFEIARDGNTKIRNGTFSVHHTYGTTRLGNGSGNQNAGLFITNATGATTCNTQCATSDSAAGYNANSGLCIHAWYTDGTNQTCTGAGTSANKVCLCAGVW